jgi:hypothetical protein
MRKRGIGRIRAFHGIYLWESSLFVINKGTRPVMPEEGPGRLALRIATPLSIETNSY